MQGFKVVLQALRHADYSIYFVRFRIALEIDVEAWLGLTPSNGFWSSVKRTNASITASDFVWHILTRRVQQLIELGSR